MKGAVYVALALLLCTQGVQAEKIYRWVDADGGVHFSAAPPPGQAADQEDLEFQRNPDPVAAEKRRKGYDEAVEKRRKAAALAAKESDEKSREAAQRRANCDNARAIVTRLESTPPHKRYRQEDGSYRVYTDADRERLIAEARTSAGEFCD